MVKMNGDQSIDSNNDESFVVLERYTEEKDSSRSTVQGESFVTPGNQNLVYPGVNQPNSSQSVVSNSTTPAVSIPMLSMESVLSMNSEEIQKRLQDLIKENADLKVTLQQHNLAMKQQFQTLKMWQDEVYKVHQVHKEKFEETKQYINKITLENKELKKALEEKPKGEVQNNEANSKLLAENAALQKQNSVLQEKLCAVIQREKKYIMQPSAKEAELNSVVESLTRQLEVAERARRQLSIDVERLNALHSRTHPPVGAPIATLEESQSHENIQPAEQVKRYNEWLQRLEKNEDDINRGSLTSWIPVDSGDVTFEIRELRKLIAQEQKLSASRKESIGEVRQCFERLLSDYQKLYLDWDWLKQEQSIKERDDAYEEVQRNGYREKVDSLTAQLVDLKDAISEKNSHIDLLTAQVNIYQSDFEAERKSREDLVGVKEKLAEDLRHLQRRNQQLLDELMRFQDGSTRNAHPQSGRSVSHSPSPVPASQPSPYVVNQPPEEIPIQTAEYTCPNPECNKVFDSFKPLERHVTQCLKLED